LHLTKLRDNEVVPEFTSEYTLELDPAGNEDNDTDPFLDFNLQEAADDIPRGESDEMWNRFCEYWTPHLDTLTIQRKHIHVTLRQSARKVRIIRKLLDSSGSLRKVSIEKYLVLREIIVPPCPKSFQYLSELSFGYLLHLLPEIAYGAYATLRQNPRLKRVSLEFQTSFDVQQIHMILSKLTRVINIFS